MADTKQRGFCGTSTTIDADILVRSSFTALESTIRTLAAAQLDPAAFFPAQREQVMRMISQLIQLAGIDEPALREMRGTPVRRSDPVVQALMRAR